MSNVAGRDIVGRATWRSYVAEIPAWAIVLGAMAVSFWTQVDAVKQHAMAWWEALIWGSSTDFGTLACLFLARDGAHRGTPTWGAWVLSAACALMSVQFNVVDGIQHRDWLEVEAHVWMPALALGVWYWTLHGRHRRWTGVPSLSPQASTGAVTEGSPAGQSAVMAPAIASSAVVTPDGATVTGTDVARATRRPGPRSSARPSVSHRAAVRAVKRAIAAGREPTTGDVERAAGVSPRQARRLLADALSEVNLGRRPRVLEGAAQPDASRPAEVP